MSDDPILAAIAALRSDMASRMDRIEAAQASLRTELVGETVSTRTVLMERMDRLQARMDQLHEECFTVLDHWLERTDGIELSRSLRPVRS